MEAKKIKSEDIVKIIDEKSSIKVMKVEDVGYFKLSKEFEEILKDKML